jgi:two-component system, OmpR family, response regulator
METAHPVIIVLTDDAWITQAVVPLLEENGCIVQRTRSPCGSAASTAATGDLLLVDEATFARGQALGEICCGRVIVVGRAASRCRQIEALESGADDYIAVPCNPREFLARARAILRR